MKTCYHANAEHGEEQEPRQVGAAPVLKRSPFSPGPLKHTGGGGHGHTGGGGGGTHGQTGGGGGGDTVITGGGGGTRSHRGRARQPGPNQSGVPVIYRER